MKNKTLPFCLVAFILGFSILWFQNPVFSGNQGSGTGPLNLNWKSVGPDNFPGRTRAVIFDSRDASGNTIFAGAVDGGIWKSTNYGLTWNPVPTENQVVPKVTCMVQDPTSGVIYAGTGEGFCTADFTNLKDYLYTTGLMGNGIWTSQDGNSFASMSGTQPAVGDVTSDWALINKLAIDPVSGRLYAATNTGLKYKDAGGSWAVAKEGNCFEVKVNSDGSVLTEVNAICYLAASGDWNNLITLSTGDSTKLPLADVGRVEFAFAPSDPNVYYASVARLSDGYLMNVYVSNDKGANWSIVFPGNSSFDPFEGRGCYDQTLVVLPNDPGQIILGGQDMWWGKKYQASGFYNWEQISFAFASDMNPMYIPLFHHSYQFLPNDPSGSKIIIASDGGVTTGTLTTGFKTNNKNYSTSQMVSVGFTYSKSVVIGGAVGNGTLLIDGTLNTPQAAYQADFEAPMGASGGYADMSTISPSAIIFTRNNGQLFGSEDRGVTTSLKFPGTVNNTVNFTPPGYLWESFNYENSRDSITYYANKGAVEAGTSVLVYSPNGKFPFNYTLPVSLAQGDSIKVVDKIQSRFFSFFTRNSVLGIHMTKDFLQFTKDPEWFLVAKIPEGVTCLTVSKDLNYLYAGTKVGKVYRVSNLALAYNYATADINSPTTIVAYELVKTFTGRAVTSISFAPEDNNRVVVTLGNYGNEDYVFLADNALDSIPNFVSIQGNLPKIPAYSSLIEMNDKNKVLIGTDNGIFSTDNVLGANWAPENSGLGTTPVFMLKQQTNFYPYTYVNDNGKIFMYPGVQNYGAIYAASYGQGIFIDTTYYSPMGIEPINGNGAEAQALQVYPNPVKDKATIAFTLSAKSDVSLNVCDINGKVVLTTKQNKLSAGNHEITIDMSGQSSGTYLIRMNTKDGNGFGKLIKTN
jgi:hypothetical protein